MLKVEAAIDLEISAIRSITNEVNRGVTKGGQKMKLE